MISSHHALIKQALSERLRKLCSSNSCKGVEAVRNNLCDPVRVFVKQEPHKLSKLLQKRFRLISSVSLVDSLEERVLYQRRTKFEIANWDSIPSKPGMGSTDQNIGVLAREMSSILEEHGVLMDDDVAGWDWQEKWYLLMATLVVNMITMRVIWDSDYGRAMRNREVAACYPVLADSAGTLYVLTQPVKCSGRFVTSFKNSTGRACLGVLAGTRPMCMGDDCNEGPLKGKSDVPNVIRKYAALGYSSKIFEVTENTTLEGSIFCSLRFYIKKNGEISAEPVRWVRSLYRLVSKKYTHADLSQFEFEVRNCREYQANDGLRKYLVANVAEVGSPQIAPN